ncbi:hypothetical protein [Gephyromycinifex aptenodytis]|uniref:hypothetical protein n=1 Tax=Gephyromycinifex aptenodytis TaxID=2716227 RepID=UPI001444E073|nr:hypothetical protein [Gephyromycinifex aptenodytis]
MPTDRSHERADHRDRLAARPRVGPLSFDERELALSTSLRLHVLTRDACLASTSVMPVKIAAVDEALFGASLSFGGRHTSLYEPVSIVALMKRLRSDIAAASLTMGAERRRLVVLDLLACLQPCSGTTWSRPLERLLAEATACTGTEVSAAEMTRLTRRLTRARRELPAAHAAPTRNPLVGAVAQAGSDVLALSPGGAVASACLLLAGWDVRQDELARGGGLVLDPLPTVVNPTAAPLFGRYLGTVVAAESPAAFAHELATLEVSASADPTVAAYVAATLPALAADLWRQGAAAAEASVGQGLQTCAQAALAAARTLPGRPRRGIHLRRFGGR